MQKYYKKHYCNNRAKQSFQHQFVNAPTKYFLRARPPDHLLPTEDVEVKNYQSATGSFISFNISAILSTCFLFQPNPLVKATVRLALLSDISISVTL